MIPKDVTVIDDTSGVRDLRHLICDPAGRPTIMPASFWDTTTVKERAMFGWLTGTYVFPTRELVDDLRARISGRTAIEIGAGDGVLADALGIPATDSRQLEKPPWNTMYGTGPKQYGPPVPYGPNIVELDAAAAVRRYRPQVVIGAFVTHKYDEARQRTLGNPAGVDELDLLEHCEEYILIGNQFVHRGKPIWDRPHRIDYPPYLFTRAANGSPNMIVSWPGTRPPGTTG